MSSPTERTWTLRLRGGRIYAVDGPGGEGAGTRTITVVEERRLREAEAENEKLRAMNRELTDSHNFYLVRSTKAEARAERAEQALQEAREALDWVTARYEATLAGRSVRDADEAICRARGVLDKGDTSTMDNG